MYCRTGYERQYITQIVVWRLEQIVYSSCTMRTTILVAAVLIGVVIAKDCDFVELIDMSKENLLNCRSEKIQELTLNQRMLQKQRLELQKLHLYLKHLEQQEKLLEQQVQQVARLLALEEQQQEPPLPREPLRWEQQLLEP
nr:MAG: hypothetical protein [Bee densovirus 4]